MSLDHKESFVKPLPTSLDRFLDKKLIIEQPLKGFRSGIDAILLGASVNNGATSSLEANLLELGSGTGVASLCALTHNKYLKALLIDNDSQMVKLGEKNIALNNMQQRARILNFDVNLGAKKFENLGEKLNYFDYIIANPPYFDIKKGTLARNENKRNARHMQQDKLDNWVRFSAACLKKRGKIIFISHIETLSHILASFEKRFGNIVILPIIAREGQNASRFLISGIRGSKAKLQLRYPLILHGQKGHQYLPKIEQIFRAKALLEW